MSTFSHEELMKLARLGAKAGLDEIQKEMDALRKAFPSLAQPPLPSKPSPATTRTRPSQAGRRGRRTVSAEERKAISERMTKYWEARRKAKKSAKR